MNKKFLTLLIGTLVSFGSLFTGLAQTPTVHYKVAGEVNFADTLRADTAHSLKQGLGEAQGVYLLSVTDVANLDLADPALAAIKNNASTQTSYVLYLRRNGELRLDTLAGLEKYYGSKIEVIQNASWCLQTDLNDPEDVVNSNVYFNFWNTAQNVELKGPDYEVSPGAWTQVATNQLRYDSTYNLATDEELILNNWHFSGISYLPGDTIEYGRPLFTWVTDQLVDVLCVEGKAADGGWKVVVKQVRAYDLLITSGGITGDVKPNVVKNVLLFTLKQLQPFVLNANDFNAIASSISFTPDAKVAQASTTTGWNPFTENEVKGTGYEPFGKGILTAYEVNDSLYRYGYLQFANTDGKWLYVDTAFWDTHNITHLAFNFSDYRRDTMLAYFDGTSYQTSIQDSAYIWGAVKSYYRPNAVNNYSEIYNTVFQLQKPDSALYRDTLLHGVYPGLDSLVWKLALYLDEHYGWMGSTSDDPAFSYANGQGGGLIRQKGDTIYIDTLAKLSGGLPALMNTVGDPKDTVALALHYILTPYPGYAQDPTIWDGGVSWTTTDSLAYEAFAIMYDSILAEARAAGYTGDLLRNPGGALGLYDYASFVANPAGLPMYTEYGLGTSFSLAADSTGYIYCSLTKGTYYGKSGTQQGIYGYASVSMPHLTLAEGKTFSSLLTFNNSGTVDTLHLNEGETFTYHLAGIPDEYYWDTTMIYQAYLNDIYAYSLAKGTDSIMENQSKFRVVYDPQADSALINVYQSRVQYTDHQTGETQPWWFNSFALTDTGLLKAADTITVPSPYISGVSFFPRPGASYHSFREQFGAASTPSYVDKVLISTADTNVFYGNNEPLTHSYLPGADHNIIEYFKDSLLYVTIQDLTQSSDRIATIAELNDEGKYNNSKIEFSVVKDCGEEPEIIETKALIPNDLYLIRNARGQFLCVPLTSAQDSIYWKTIEPGEDPTQMPAYQWVLVNRRANVASGFSLTNREFEHVVIDYAEVAAEGDHPLNLASSTYANASFNKNAAAKGYYVYGGIDTLGKGEFSKITDATLKTHSFFALDASVKTDQLLGYTYIDKDDAYLNVYALKNKYFAAPEYPRYLGWNGSLSSISGADAFATVSTINLDKLEDRLYFAFVELDESQISSDARVIIKKTNGVESQGLKDYRTVYNTFVNGSTYLDSVIVLENYGYQPKLTNGGYDTAIIKDLLPLARQAYAFQLKDYFKYNPGLRNDYLLVGATDHYAWGHTSSWTTYQNAGNSAKDLFGKPHFYLRNTAFPTGFVASQYDVETTYYVLLQRIDTTGVTQKRTPATGTKYYEDVENYLQCRFGTAAGAILLDAIVKTQELTPFIAYSSPEPDQARLLLGVRGEDAITPSLFTHEVSNDPIYRRFNVNEPVDNTTIPITGIDKPQGLKFFVSVNDPTYTGGVSEHLVEVPENANYLFENSGGDRTNGGGYFYNVKNPNDPKANWELWTDSLGDSLSYLGVKNIRQFPELSASENGNDPNRATNYTIYVDTAFINRGTGWIKPQYMLAVDTFYQKPMSCNCEEGQPLTQEYLLGRYLYNTAMYGKQIVPSAADIAAFGGNGENFNVVQPISPEDIKEPAYLYNNWERPAFAWAIHRGDYLYVIKASKIYNLGKYDARILHDDLVAAYPKLRSNGYAYSTPNTIDFDKLEATRGQSGDLKLHAKIYLGDNTHKDWVWSFRYIERGASDFTIESETVFRDRTNPQTIIAPQYGGWISYAQNEMVPVISRTSYNATVVPGDPAYGSYHETMYEPAIFNVVPPVLEAVANPAVAKAASTIKVVSEEGAVTVLNASGKQIVISNILGQTLVNTVVQSDKARIALPKGIAFISVPGETSVKAVVK